VNNESGTILLVDDEAAIRRLLHRTLTAAGYRCLEAGDALQARERLDAGKLELVILDIKMPGKSGLEFLPEIAANFPGVAVIMATAMEDAGTVIQAMKQGAYDYLLKPFNLEEVVMSVNKALEVRRLRMENRDYQLNLEKKVGEQTAQIRESYLNTLKALVRTVEIKDEYTNDHSRRVADIAVAIAREIELRPEDIEKIRIAGLIHDFGKIGIRESILNKPGKLTAAEYQEIQKHVGIGADILMLVIDDRLIIETIVHHHEHYDGSGYPDRLAGERIPLGARILAMADAYDAMTSTRPYRPEMSPGEAAGEINRNKGAQFDPFIADLMLRLIQKQAFPVEKNR
jgi:putative two-component system response regulator